MKVRCSEASSDDEADDIFSTKGGRGKRRRVQHRLFTEGYLGESVRGVLNAPDKLDLIQSNMSAMFTKPVYAQRW